MRLARHAPPRPGWDVDTNSRTNDSPVVLELRRGSARRVDLLPRGAGEPMCLDRRGAADSAGPEDLARLAPPYGALRGQDVRVDLAAVREQRRQLVEVDDLVLGPERVLEALELGDPHVERHLAALERLGHLVARLRALGAAAGGLALGALAPADPRLGLVRAGSRAQVMDLERHRLLDLLDRHEVLDGPDHPADLRPIFLDDDVAQPLETERAQGLALTVRAADGGTLLGDLEARHLRLLPPQPQPWPPRPGRPPGPAASQPARRPRSTSRGGPRSPRGGAAPSA